MSRFQTAKGAAMLLGARALLRTCAALGDPGAQVAGMRPGDDPYVLYQRARARGPLTRSRLGMYITATHEVATEILRDPRFGVAERVEQLLFETAARDAMGHRPVNPVSDSFLALDPPRHTRLRRTVAPWFTPKSLRERVPSIEKVVDRHLDNVSDRQGFDLIDDFAAPVATEVICDMFGLAEHDQTRFATWGVSVGAAIDGIRTMGEIQALRQTLVDMEQFFDDLIADRRRSPGDDVVSSIITAEPEGEPLTREDLLATCEVLLVAGFETTRNLIGNAVLALDADPETHRRFVAHPDQAPQLVEEALRLDSPIQVTARVATEPATIAGIHLKPKTVVMLLLAGANRDPATFPRPDRLDLDRPNSREHLSFASGIHYCIGAGLSRATGAVALERLYSRFPELTVAGPVTWRKSRNVRGALHLPVRVSAPVPS